MSLKKKKVGSYPNAMIIASLTAALFLIGFCGLLVMQSKKLISIIKQNIVASLAVKAIFFVLAMIGYASLWGAIAADMGMSLLVIMNGLRLLRPTHTEEKSVVPQT